MSPLGNHDSSREKLRFARSLYQNLSKCGQFFYHNMLVPWNDTMPSFMIFRRVLNFQEFKNQVSQCSRPTYDAEMFEFHSHFLHGTYKFTQRHTCDFSTNFGALEHVLVFQIWIMNKRWHVPSQNHEPSWEKLRFARNLYQNLFLFCQFFYHSMVVPWHDTMPSFMIFRRVLDLQEF